MTDRKKQIEEAWRSDVRVLHKDWIKGAEWADANPDTTKHDERRRKAESILLPEKYKMAQNPMTNASEATLKKYADREEGHDISAGGPPSPRASESANDSKDERDAEEYVKSRFKYLDGRPAINEPAKDAFLAGRKGMVTASEVERVRKATEDKWAESTVRAVKVARIEADEIWRPLVAEAVKAERERCVSAVSCVEFSAEGLNQALRKILNSLTGGEEEPG